MSTQYTPAEWTEIQAEAEQTGESIKTFSTREEVIQQEIAPALDEPSDYNLDAIFDDCFEWAAIVDKSGVQHGNGWFQQSVSDTAFWASVEKHTL